MPTMSEPSAAIASRKIDLSGAWEAYYDGPAFVKAIGVKQDGDLITAEDLVTDSLAPTGRAFFRGAYAVPTGHLRIEVAEYAGLAGLLGQPRSWDPTELTIGDPDHFRIGNHSPFQRLSNVHFDDVPCDQVNSLHVQAQYALIRGELAEKANEFAIGVCWFYIAATQGHSKAQSFLSVRFRDGAHTQKNPGLAFYWANASANQGDPDGALALADLYQRGIGTPADPDKAALWRQRSQEFRAKKQQQQLAEQREDEKRKQAMEALSWVALSGAAILADPGPPPPCRTLEQLRSRSSLTPGEVAEVQNAKAQIAAEKIKCP